LPPPRSKSISRISAPNRLREQNNRPLLQRQQQERERELNQLRPYDFKSIKKKRLIKFSNSNNDNNNNSKNNNNNNKNNKAEEFKPVTIRPSNEVRSRTTIEQLNMEENPNLRAHNLVPQFCSSSTASSANAEQHEDSDSSTFDEESETETDEVPAKGVLPTDS